jgi:putative FmdB family regulatory protein
MPLYEYRCASCGERFEVLQRLGEGADGLTCPGCGAAEPSRQLSTFAAGASSTGFGGGSGGAACGGGSGFT